MLFSAQNLWTVLTLAIGIWLSVSWVLNYHWKTYGHHTSVVSQARRIYFIGSLALIILTAILIITL